VQFANGYTFLGFNEPFLYELDPINAAKFWRYFSRSSRATRFIAKGFFEEETAFLRNFGKRPKNLDQIKDRTQIKK